MTTPDSGSAPDEAQPDDGVEDVQIGTALRVERGEDGTVVETES